MSKQFWKRGAAGAFALWSSAFAVAQSPDGAAPTVVLSELFVNPPGTDNGQEFIELSGTPGTDLGDYAIIIIEGDGAAAGVVDAALPLTGQSLGANGIFLRRDAASAIVVGSHPAYFTGPSPATVVQVADFNPDLENGSNTYLLVKRNGAALPIVGADWDTNNDGVLEAGVLGSLIVVDAVALIENDTGANLGYADDLGFPHVGPFSGTNGFNADVLYRERTCLGAWLGWRAGDVVGMNPGGPYAFDDVRTSGFPFGPGLSWSIDPGRPNHGVFALAMTAPGGFGTLDLTHAGGEPGALLLTALSFLPANGSAPYVAPLGNALHAGLNLTVDDLAAQFLFFAPPFVDVLDGTGAALFSYAGGLPPEFSGLTMYASSYCYSGVFGDLAGRTPVASITF